jgi:hypothetical protein
LINIIEHLVLTRKDFLRYGFPSTPNIDVATGLCGSMNGNLTAPSNTVQNFFTLELLNVTGGGLMTRHYPADAMTVAQNPKGFICEYEGESWRN